MRKIKIDWSHKRAHALKNIDAPIYQRQDINDYLEEVEVFARSLLLEYSITDYKVDNMNAFDEWKSNGEIPADLFIAMRLIDQVFFTRGHLKTFSRLTKESHDKSDTIYQIAGWLMQDVAELIRLSEALSVRRGIDSVTAKSRRNADNSERNIRISKAYLQGVTVTDIATRFGIEKSRIYQILREMGECDK